MRFFSQGIYGTAFSVVALTFIFIFSGNYTVAQEYFIINNYEIDIELKRSETFHVKEIIDVTFSEQRHGIYRDIPFKYRLENGKTHKIKLSNIEVVGRQQKISTSGSNKRIRIGNPDKYVDGKQTYVIEYDVTRAFLYQEDFDEWYWNLIGSEWTVPIEEANFSVSFPSELRLTNDDIRAYAGPAGTQSQELAYSFEGNTITGNTTNTLQPGDALTLAVKLPKGIIPEPSAMQVAIRNYGLLAIPAVFLSLLIAIFSRIGYDKPIPTVVEFYPPEELTPSEAGAFIDDNVGFSEVLALIPYWAAGGFIEMNELTPASKGFFGKKGTYELNKLKDLPADRPEHEQVVFRELFIKNGPRIDLQDVKHKFTQTAYKSIKALNRSMIQRNYYTKSSVKWRNWLPAIWALCFVGFMVLVINLFILAAFSFLIVGVVGIFMQTSILKKNEKGREVFQKLKGFRQFIKKAEQDRLRVFVEQDPTYFDKTLPYAVAFNLADEWTEKFDGILTQPPAWYHGVNSSTHSYHNFSEGFDAGIGSVRSAFTSKSSSSGGSGGSSGGGFGGGGGGSW